MSVRDVLWSSKNKQIRGKHFSCTGKANVKRKEQNKRRTSPTALSKRARNGQRKRQMIKTATIKKKKKKDGRMMIMAQHDTCSRHKWNKDS